ncbi:MAG: hypothetical protein AAF766_13625 [Cyanobacteria bacterium P01_D01_bin.14]
MKPVKPVSKTHRRFYKPLLATALAVGGVFNMVGMVLAEGTAAGTQITNTATATYRDPDGNPQTATSNTVVVEVAEIAGITVVNTSADKKTPDGNPAGPGDQLEYVFDITNVGNDETDISLPATAAFTGPVDSVVAIELIDPATGARTPITSRTDFENLAPGGTIQVAVTVLTSSSAINDDVVTVTYGDTPGNAQNQPFDASGGSIFTDDNDADDVNGVGGASQTAAEAGPNAPANGEREASATGQVTIGAVPLEQPLVKIEKTQVGPVADKGTPTYTDDEITYSLSIDVLDDSAVPLGSDATAADLESIAIQLNAPNNYSRRILVSDALPAGTTLAATQPTVPGGWQRVFTDYTGDNALEAVWYTDAADLTGSMTRVGFISAENATMAVGSSQTDLDITVVASGVNDSAPSITIANIAQVFGSGVVDDPLTPEDESLTFPVMDESGDQTPSNYDDTTGDYSDFNPDVIDDPSTPLPEGFQPGDGFIDDSSDLVNTGEDTGKDNTGTPEDGTGEALVVTLLAEAPSNILNGPQGAPGAIGPTGTNDDFTNKSTTLSGGDPPVVKFTNTVENGSGEDGWVKLEPIAPADPNALPNGTEATIVSPDGTRTLFTYSGGTWTNTTGADVIVPVRATDGVAGLGDDQFDYGVEVDLPSNPAEIQELDSFPVPIQATFAGLADVNAVDGDNADTIVLADVSDVLSPDPLNPPPNPPTDPLSTNVTIDRVYTGFLELIKTAQVVQGDGPPVTGSPAPGNNIRYRITYRNISETESGTMQDNRLLTASDLALIEDGTELACANAPSLITTNPDGSIATSPNNWAMDNDDVDGDGDAGTGLDTRHVLSSVNLANLDPGSTASITFYSGGPECDPASGLPAFEPATATPTPEQAGTSYGTDSTKYVFDITGDINPQETGFVEFERRVN